MTEMYAHSAIRGNKIMTDHTVYYLLPREQRGVTCIRHDIEGLPP